MTPIKRTMTRFIIFTLLILSSLTPAWAGQGWVLIVPPPTSGNNLRIFSFADERDFLAGAFDITAALAKWVQLKSFDSVNDCEEFRKNKTYFWTGDIGEDPGEAKIREQYETKIRKHIEASRCIASDDPRLK
jgi:hypothetical protein